MSQQINLINPLLLKRRHAFGLREMALGAGLVLAAVLAWGGYLNYQAGALEALASRQEARQAQAQRELDQLNAAAQRPASVLLTERVKATQAQVAQREALLAALKRTLETTSNGFAARLRALANGRVEGVWLNEFTLSPDYVGLKGGALDAGLLTDYLDRLGRQAPFAGMQFSGMNAGPAQASGGKAGEPMRGQIEFALYSGSEKKSAAGEPRDGQ